MSTEDRSGFSLKETFPLHYLAKVGDHQELERFLKVHPAQAVKQISRLDFSGRTILHYAAVGVNFSGCEKCVEAILLFLNGLEGETKETFENISVRRQTQRIRRQAWIGSDTQATVNFVNIKNTNGETAIHLAARNENPNIVIILLMHSADVMSVAKDGTQSLKLIYSNTPSAVTELLNRSVSFDHGVDSDSFVKTERSYCLDFTVVIGNTSDESNSGVQNSSFYQETLCLNSVNENESKVRKEILTHPLVRFFVEKKFRKLVFLILCSLILKVLWIGLYIWQAIDIYYDCCESALIKVKPGLSQNQTVFCSQYPFTQEIMQNSNWTLDDENTARSTVINCAHDNNKIYRLVIIIILTIYVLFTIISKSVILTRLYIKIQNGYLWLFTLLMLITLFPTTKSYRFQFQIAAFAIILGAIVILEVINKHIYWAIYIRVLIKVVKRFVAILPLFIFIILAFSVSLRMLFPTANPALKDFRDAFMEVFSVIANGKVEWSEGNNYRDDVDSHFEVTGFIMFIVFYVLLILLLFRILIGFVVADTKKIQEQEELNEISQDLKSIFLFESISSSKMYEIISNFGPFKFLQTFRAHFLICGNEMQLWLGESEIPAHLRKQMRNLAAKNPVKINSNSNSNGNLYHRGKMHRQITVDENEEDAKNTINNIEAEESKV